MSAAALLLGGCAATDTGRRPIYDSAYYAPVDGAALNIFVDPIGTRDLLIPQRLGRLDVPPQASLFSETERAAAARARLNSRPSAVPATPGQITPKLDPTAQPGPAGPGAGPGANPTRARSPARAAAPGIAPPPPAAQPSVTLVPANGATPLPAAPAVPTLPEPGLPGPGLPGPGLPGPVTKPASP